MSRSGSDLRRAAAYALALLALLSPPAAEAVEVSIQTGKSLHIAVSSDEAAVAEDPATRVSFAAPLDCIRTENPDAFLPAGARLGEASGDLGSCRAAKRGLACAAGGAATETAGNGRLLDFDRVCESAKCEAGEGPAAQLVRIHSKDGFELRELSLSCRLIEEMDDEAGPADGKPPNALAAVTCGDFTSDGSYAASDALGTLRSAVGSVACLICICDVNNSNSITSSDALLVLRKAVGQEVTFNCQPDGTPIAWDGGGDGVNWTDPNNWSLNRIPNACDDATLQSGSATHASGTNSVRNVSSSVPLQFTGGKLDVRGTVTAPGATQLKGGTIARADWLKPGNNAPLVITSLGGTLDAVSMAADLDLSGASAYFYSLNGFTLDGKATIGSNAGIYFPASGKVALDGSGEVLMGGAAAYLYNYGSTSLSIGAGIFVHGTGGYVGGNQTNANLANAGTIDSDAGGTMTVGNVAGTMTNTGTLRASNGTLTIQGNWSNAGTIDLEPAGVLNLAGNFASATFGNLDRSGGIVNLTGSMDLSTPFTLDSSTGDWKFLGGTLKNGTLDADDGAKLVYTSSGGTLNAVVMNADMDMTASSANAQVLGGLTLNGLLSLGTSGALYFPSSTLVALGGTGDVLMSGPSTYLYNYGSTSFSIGAGIFIHGSGGNVGGNQTNANVANAGTIDSDSAGNLNVGNVSGTLSNTGTLRASNGTLTLLGAWTNTGTIDLDAAGVLNLAGTFNSSSLGTLDRSGGTVNLTGVMTLSSPFTLNSTTGDWKLVGGTLKDGTLNASNGAKLVYTSNGGTLNNVVMNADMDLTGSSANASVLNGITINGLASLGNSGALYFPASSEVAIDGTGDILMSGLSGYLYNYGSTTLTIGSGIFIHGSGGNIGGNQTNANLTNAGVIDSDAAGTLNVGNVSGSLSNTGTLRASNGTLTLLGAWSNSGTIDLDPTGVLNLGGTFSTTGFGTFTRDQGTVNLTGALTLNSPFTLNSTTGSWRLVGGTLKDGTLNSANGSKLIFTSNGGTLNNIVASSDLDLTGASANANVTNGITINGVANLGTSGALYFPASPEVAIDGTGDILMGGASTYLYNYGSTTLTLGADLLIHGSSGNVGGNQTSANVTSAATIDSDGGGNINVGNPSGASSSSGTLNASAGSLTLLGPWSSSGDIHIGAGRIVNAGSTFAQTAAGELSVDIGGTMTSQFGKMAITGAATLAGTLKVNLVSGFVPSLGNTFQILTFASSSGSFGTFTGADITGPNKFQVTTSPTSITLTVVPD